ncbi:MAG: hypothetical protein K8R28_04010, partial [Desulfobacterales bacterium]|nr:hypothetical protein [Desulfobacterales bacterium]
RCYAWLHDNYALISVKLQIINLYAIITLSQKSPRFLSVNLCIYFIKLTCYDSYVYNKYGRTNE